MMATTLDNTDLEHFLEVLLDNAGLEHQWPWRIKDRFSMLTMKPQSKAAGLSKVIEPHPSPLPLCDPFKRALSSNEDSDPAPLKITRMTLNNLVYFSGLISLSAGWFLPTLTV